MPDDQRNHRADHLKAYQWERGESGNPNGRPKGTVGLITRVKEVLRRENKQGVSLADELAEILVKESMRNPAKMWAFIQEFLDRDEGPVTQNMNLINPEDQVRRFREAVKAMDKTVPKPEDCNAAEEHNGTNGNGGVNDADNN